VGKIADIYVLSADYDENNEITKKFYATLQKKLHWVICVKTSAKKIFLMERYSKIM
jgi:hypothetical protein